MKFGMSNIAWAPEKRLDAYAAMANAGMSGLEIAPSLLFADEPDPFAPSDMAIDLALDEIANAGLQLISMQSLHFGLTGAALFGSPSEMETFIDGIRRAIDLAPRLGIANLVVGSPRNRAIPETMPYETALDRAVDVFRHLGDLAAEQSAVLALEPNPAIYGTNFMTDMEETFAVVKRVDHPAVKLNFDIGSLHVNETFENLADLFDMTRACVSHVHVSEPDLAAAPANEDEAAFALSALQAGGYDKWVSIEMRAMPENDIAGVTRSISRLMAAADRCRIPGGSA